MKSFLLSAEKIMVIAFSPTGNGHVIRVLDIVKEAVLKGYLKPNDGVILHIGKRVNNLTYHKQINSIIEMLLSYRIFSILAIADKAINGHFDDKNSSDNVRILEEFAYYPLIEQVNEDILTTGKLIENLKKFQTCNPANYLYDQDNISSLTISAYNLLKSLVKILPKEKILILTDMCPYLQKAARKLEIPLDNCLDQQTHSMLLEDDHKHIKYAVLSKILCGYGQKISPIKLGEKNSLFEINQISQKLGITPNTTQAQTTQIIIQLLLKYAYKLGPPSIDTIKDASIKTGILIPPTLDENAHLVYIYAHHSTPMIFKYIHDQIINHQAGYDNKLFLICGHEQLLFGKDYFNPLKLAYLAAGHGIMTAGGGTTGEFSYLLQHAKQNVYVALLPQYNQNEQEVNAKYIKRKHPEHIYLGCTNEWKEAVDALIATEPAPNNYSMETFLNAVTSEDTYIRQAIQSLFENNEDIYSLELKIILNSIMKEPILIANRRYLKFIFQILSQLPNFILNNEENLTVKITSHGSSYSIYTYNQINDILTEHLALLSILGLNPEQQEQLRYKEPKEIYSHYENVLTFFNCINVNPTQVVQKVEQLKTELAQTVILGF